MNSISASPANPYPYPFKDESKKGATDPWQQVTQKRESTDNRPIDSTYYCRVSRGSIEWKSFMCTDWFPYGWLNNWDTGFTVQLIHYMLISVYKVIIKRCSYLRLSISKNEIITKWRKRKESQEEKLNLSWMDPERVSEDWIRKQVKELDHSKEQLNKPFLLWFLVSYRRSTSIPLPRVGKERDNRTFQ